jgi:hypothetical protein
VGHGAIPHERGDQRDQANGAPPASEIEPDRYDGNPEENPKILLSATYIVLHVEYLPMLRQESLAQYSTPQGVTFIS